MRIDEPKRVGLERTKALDSLNKMVEETVSFSDVLQQQNGQMTRERMKKLLQQIDEQGERLLERRTVKELREYKALVKSFMDEAVRNGVSLEERQGFNRRGRTKIYKILREVDTKLIDLTNAVLDKEKKGIDILSQVGEIKGLLINLYL